MGGSTPSCLMCRVGVGHPCVWTVTERSQVPQELQSEPPPQILPRKSSAHTLRYVGGTAPPPWVTSQTPPPHTFTHILQVQNCESTIAPFPFAGSLLAFDQPEWVAYSPMEGECSHYWAKMKLHIVVTFLLNVIYPVMFQKEFILM